MSTSKLTQRAVSLFASALVTFALVEVIADYALVDAGPMIVVQAEPAPNTTPANPPQR